MRGAEIHFFDAHRAELPEEQCSVGEANYGVYIYVPPGEYRVMCMDYAKPKQMSSDKNDVRIIVRWLVVDGEYAGKRLFQSYKYYRKYNFSSKLFQDYMLANGGGPKRNDRMSPAIFKNGEFVAKVVTVKSQYREGSPKYKERPKAQWYSVVECLVSKVGEGASSDQSIEARV